MATVTPDLTDARWFANAARILKANGFKIQVTRNYQYTSLTLIGRGGAIYGLATALDLPSAIRALLLEIFKPDMRYNSKLSSEEFESREHQRFADEQAVSFEDFCKYFEQVRQRNDWRTYETFPKP